MTAPAMAFGTKAETLERLGPVLNSARVLPQLRFTVGEWQADAAATLARLENCAWSRDALIVRSSAQAEDALQKSQAGHFRSVPDVVGASQVSAAIGDVAQSLMEGSVSSGDPRDDQIFIQPMLCGVRMSGVVFTRDPSCGSHYIVVSYDNSSGSTSSITGGRAEDRRTYYYHSSSPDAPVAELAGVIELARELEQLFGEEALDIEFAIDGEGQVVLLQVRALHVSTRSSREQESRALERVSSRIKALSEPHPYVFGQRAVFGNMPDWNPAEVIGVRPKPLAMSLYKELITDSIWAYQRSNYGYRNMRSFPLMISLGGLPYIDVRVSFNSFIPADIDEDLGRRLVDVYTERLIAAPEGHDKIEFDIVYSCYTLDLPQRLEKLAEFGFSAEDRTRLASSLRQLTNRVTATSTSLFRLDVEKISELERRQEAFEREAGGLDRVARMYWLLENCKRYGTLPFAGIARAAFMAVQLLDSLVELGVMSPEERQAFMGSLHTVGARMGEDLAELPRAAFLERYGHLRPGTYDITSRRYDLTPDAYISGSLPTAKSDAGEELFELSQEQAREVNELLRVHQLDHDASSLFAFLRDAIRGREHAKFVFTRSLSDALELFAELGAELGFSREELAFTDIELLQRLYAGSEDVGAVVGASIEEGKMRFAGTRRMTLPPLVTDPAQAFGFQLPVSDPNFVTMMSAEGPVVAVRESTAPNSELRGSIVMIPSADPGHDWIFSHRPAGFITLFGGYNSHMAIRANELGIPAVIGAGESLFRAWGAASALRLDCLNRRVEVLH